jgi:hypothetical protein
MHEDVSARFDLAQIRDGLERDDFVITLQLVDGA